MELIEEKNIEKQIVRRIFKLDSNLEGKWETREVTHLQVENQLKQNKNHVTSGLVGQIMAFLLRVMTLRLIPF